MARLDSLIDNKIVQNLFVWFFLFLVLTASIQGTDNRVIAALTAILVLAPSIYIQNLLILPYFRRHNFKFLLFTFLNAAIFAVLIVFLMNKSFSGLHSNLKMFFNFLGVQLLALFLSAGLKIARDSFTRRQQEKEAELKLLKAQLNPHFLFNTLNNLYGLSVVKSDKLPNLMLKLSDLLRYSLYETKETLVSLEKEIMYLENYISLEKIRLEDKTNIQFTKSGNFSSKKIAPMLLIVFVENAFKHLGILEDGKSNITISLEELNNKITFTCNNTIEKLNAEDDNLEKGRNGIGLQNAKKRLALMYPDKHQLVIDDKNNNYNIQLTVDL